MSKTKSRTNSSTKPKDIKGKSEELLKFIEDSLKKLKKVHDYVYGETKRIAENGGILSKEAKDVLQQMDEAHQRLGTIKDRVLIQGAKTQADILQTLANSADSSAKVSFKSSLGLSKELEKLEAERAKVEEEKGKKAEQLKSRADKYEKTGVDKKKYGPEFQAEQLAKFDSKFAEIEAQQMTVLQEQTNRLIAEEENKKSVASTIKESIPAAIEKAKADCSCIEQAFEKYFRKDNLSALCCNGAAAHSNDNALFGESGDDFLLGGAGNDPLVGGGFNSGLGSVAINPLNGTAQQTSGASLLPDPRKENEQAQELEGIYKTVSSTIGNSFTQLFQDVIVRGKSFRESLSSLFGNIANSLLNTFLDKVMGSLSKGISGFVEQALPSIFNFFFAANGGVMTSGGPLPLRTYAKGGIATSPQMAIFGEGSMNEAYVPLPDGRRIPVNMNMEGKPANDRGNVYQITQNVTVQGTPGQSQEDSDRVAAQMMDSLDRAMTEKIDDRIRQSQRVGGISNPLRRIA